MNQLLLNKVCPRDFSLLLHHKYIDFFLFHAVKLQKAVTLASSATRTCPYAPLKNS